MGTDRKCTVYAGKSLRTVGNQWFWCGLMQVRADRLVLTSIWNWFYSVSIWKKDMAVWSDRAGLNPPMMMIIIIFQWKPQYLYALIQSVSVTETFWTDSKQRWWRLLNSIINSCSSFIGTLFPRGKIHRTNKGLNLVVVKKQLLVNSEKNQSSLHKANISD